LIVESFRLAGAGSLIVCGLPAVLTAVLSAGCPLVPISIKPVDDGDVARYEITDLGIDVMNAEHGPRSINAKGEVSGTLDKVGILPRSVGFFWRKRHLTELIGPEGTNTSAVSVNDTGQVVGMSHIPGKSQAAFLWNGATGRLIERVPGFEAAGDVHIYGMNNLGQIIGCSYRFDGAFTAYLVESGNSIPAEGNGNKRAPLPGDLTIHSPRSPVRPVPLIPQAINDHAEITGLRGGGVNIEAARGVFWRAGQTTRPAQIGTLPGGLTAHPHGINNHGEVVGAAATQQIYSQHAFVWDGERMLDLGTCGGRSSEALAINDSHQVIGLTDVQYEEIQGDSRTTWGGNRAVLWLKDKSNTYQGHILNDLLPAGSGWVLERAVAINKRGQIVGTGYRSDDRGKNRKGTNRGFLLTPVNRNASGLSVPHPL
jgi:probable HAF family extracellular repeat protein